MKLSRGDQTITVEVADEAGTERLAQALAGVFTPNTVVALVGPLGAGKTRLVRAIAEAFGVDPGAIASPTFVLIHEYAGRLPIFHFDTYRLESPDAFDDLGAADYWGAGGVCLVEWADRVADRLPADRWTIEIEPTGPTSRRFSIRAPESARGLLDRVVADLSM